MSLQGVTSIRYDVDYSQVQKAIAAVGNLFTTVFGLTKQSADGISRSFVDAQGKIALASKAASDAVTRVRTKQENDVKALIQKSAKDEIDARARVDKARKDGLNSVREAIFKGEKEIRDLRLKLAHEVDAAEKKNLAEKIKRMNAELQMHRSSEKELTGGRTFTEQLEKNFNGPIIGQMAMMKGMFSQMREAASAPVAGTGIMGTMGAFASKAVPFVAAGVAVGAALKGIVDVGMEYQDAMADLSAITGVAGPQLDSLGEKARNLAMRYGIDAKDGVEAFKLAISALGPQVAQDEAALNSMGESIMTLAKASGVDAQTATSALTNTLNQFGFATADSATQAEQMKRIMNVMAAGSKEGAAEVADLSMSMKEVGTVANLAGVSIEATVGSLEILSQNGIKGAEAGTGLRNVLLSLSAGTEQSEEVLKKLGLTFNDINPKTVGYEKSLATVRGAMDNLKNPTDKAILLKKLFGKENAATANILMQSTKSVDGHASALNKMTLAVTGTNTANEQAKTKMATMSETWNRISSAVKDVAISIFEALQPAIQSIMEAFESALPTIKDVASVIGTALSVAIKGLKITIEVAIFPLKLLWNTFKAIGEFLVKTLSPAFTWFKDKILTPIGNAVMAVGTAIVNAWTTVKQWVSDAVAWIEEKWRDVQGFLSDISLGLIDEPEEKKATPKAAPKPTAQTPAVAPVAPTDPVTPSLLSGDSGGGKGKGKTKAELDKEKFDKAREAAENAYKEDLLALQNALLNKEITEDVFDRRKVSKEIAHNENLSRIAIANGQSDLDFRQRISDLKLDIAQKSEEEQKKIMAEIAKEIEDGNKLAIENEKKAAEEKLKRQKEYEDREIALMDEGIAKKLAMEDLRFKRELEMADLSAEAKLQIEQLHAKNIADITNSAEAEKAKEVSKYTDLTTEFFNKGYKDRSKFLHESIATDILGQEKGYFKQRGLLKRFLVDQLKTFLTNKIAEVLIHTQTETTKTGVTQTGTLARIAATVGEVASSIAAAAASAFNAVAQGVRWVFTTVPFPWSIAVAGAVPAAVYGLYRGAKSLFKFAEGAIVDRPQRFQFGPNGEHDGLRGEAGKEAIIPLESERGRGLLREALFGRTPVIQTVPSMAMASGGGNFLSEKFDRLIDAVEQEKFAVFDQRKQKLSADEYARDNKRRRLT